MENDKLKKFIKTTIREFLNENKNQSIGEIRDYLKSNCRSWEYDCDNYDDTVSLTNHIHDKYPELTFEEIFDVVKDWTGYEEKDDNF